MKNEEKVLLQVLNSIYPILDHYTVVDTGSTDNSKQIVKDFFESKGIKGEIYNHPFINFENARNFALDQAKDKTDFSLIIDADEILNFSSDFNLSTLKAQLSNADRGVIEIRSREINYGRVAFYRNSKPFKWQGVVHEVLVCNEPIVEKNITGISITQTTQGASWKQGTKEKYLGHAKILHEYMNKNGLDPRNVFYLAQSYKDAGEPKKAIEWYEKRTEMNNGFYEELYYSRLMIAGLKWQLSYPVMDVADEYMCCGELDELRAEHLYFLRSMYQKNGRPQAALKITELLAKYKNPYPQRILFINPLAYLQ